MAGVGRTKQIHFKCRIRSREEFSRRLQSEFDHNCGEEILDEVDFMVEEGGLRGRNGYDGGLGISGRMRVVEVRYCCREGGL